MNLNLHPSNRHLTLFWHKLQVVFRVRRLLQIENAADLGQSVSVFRVCPVFGGGQPYTNDKSIGQPYPLYQKGAPAYSRKTVPFPPSLKR